MRMAFASFRASSVPTPAIAPGRRPPPQAFNVLHYAKEQHYDSHMDSFDPKDFGPQPSQRIATVLLYLSEVLEGGETVFKKEGVDGARRPCWGSACIRLWRPGQ
jgi:hypothetical protein